MYHIAFLKVLGFISFNAILVLFWIFPMIISYQKWIGLNGIGLTIYQNTVEWLLNTKDNAVLWSYSGNSDTVSTLFGNTCTLVQAKQEGDDPPLSHMNSGYSWAPSQDFRGYVFNPNLKSLRSLHVLF